MLSYAISFVKGKAEKFRDFCADKVSDIVYASFDDITGEAYVDTGVKILIAVVIGALILGGLYALFNTTIMPTVTSKITALFNYRGTT